MKTHKGAAKRFKVSGTGKVIRNKANAGHIMTKKSRSRKRNLRQHGVIDSGSMDRVKKMLVKL